MSYGPHHQIRTGRGPELLENLKNEFDSMTHDLNLFKMQRDEYDRKLQAQLGELNTIQQTLYELERNHAKIKQQYEDEILRLRRQLDMNQPSGGAGSGSSGTGGTPSNSGREPIISSPLQFRANSPQPGQNRTPTASSSISTEKGPLPFGDSKSGRQPSFPSSNSGKRGRENSTEFPYAAQQQPGFPQLLSPIAPNDGTTPKHPKTERGERGGKEIDTLPPPLPALRDHNKETPSRNGMHNMEMTISPKDNDTEKPPRSTRAEMMEEENKEKNGSDWIVGYNPQVQTNLNIDLMHNLNHTSVVCCVKFSADGKYLSTGCNRSAQIYDVETGKKVHNFADDTAKDTDLYIRSVSFSPDGQYLATGAEDKTVRVWDIQHKRILHTFVGHELDIYSLDFSHDGRFIVSGSGDKKAKIWDIDKGKCAYTLGNEEVGPKDGVTSVAISPDGRLVAADRKSVV